MELDSNFQIILSPKYQYLRALRVKKKLFDGYDGLAYIIDEAINDGSILSQSLKEGDEKLGNSNFFTLILLLSFFW